MKISVVICTRNRREDLKRTLYEFSNQKYDDFEIIVIDNASDDGTDEMVKSEFPEVKYTYLPVNIDILAQNIGVYQAKGEVIWRTDSDSFPENHLTFSKVIELFNSNPGLDIISTKEVLVKYNYKEITPASLVKKDGNDKEGYEVKSFTGPGAAIKKEIFDEIGGYWEFGMEEIDFSTRALRAGFKIRYFPKIRILHFSSPGDRDETERWIKISNQMMRYIIKYYPASRLYNAIVCYFFQIILGIVKFHNFSGILQNIFQLVSTALSTWRNEREPLNKEEYNKILKGNSYISGFFDYIKQKLK